VWNVRTTKPDYTVLNVGSEAYDVRFAPQVNFSLTLATAANDGVRVWTVAGGVPRDIGLIKDRQARLVAFRDRSLVAGALVKYHVNYTTEYDQPDRISFWNAADGADVATLVHDSEIRALAFSPDKRLIASGAGKTLRLWSADSKGTEKTPLWEFSFGGSVSSVAFSQDSQHLAAGSTDGTYRVWNLNTSAYKVGAAINVGQLTRSLCLSSSKLYLPKEEWTKLFPNEKWRDSCPAVP
jgi:WD40 repeat protein